MKKKKRRPLFFNGFMSYDNSPIYTLQKTVMTHGLHIGSSGSGKSAWLLMFVEQLLLHGYSVVVIDPKCFSGELRATLMGYRSLVNRMWWLSDQPGQSSHLFSVMHQHYWGAISATAKTGVLLSSMAISLVRRYGEMFFADLSAAGFFVALSKYPDVVSFRELARCLNDELDDPRDLPKAVEKHGLQTSMILDRLSELDNFNYDERYSKPVLEGQIDFSRLYKEQCAVFCGLDTTKSPLAAPELARILLASTLLSGVVLDPKERKVPVVVIKDEYNAYLSPGLTKNALNIARAADCSLHLATQSLSDLKLGHGADDTTPTVLNNTAMQLFHAVRDEAGLRTLLTLGGKTLSSLKSETTSDGPNGITNSTTVSQNVVPRFDVNQIDEISAAEDQFLMRIRKNDVAPYDGHLFAARCGYHISEEEYQRRCTSPWPEPEEDTLIVGGNNRADQSNDDADSEPQSSPFNDGPTVTSGPFGA